VGDLDWINQYWPIGPVGNGLPEPDRLTNPKLAAQLPGLLGLLYGGQPESEEPAVSRGDAPFLKVSDTPAARADGLRQSPRPTPTPTTYTGEASYYPDDKRNTASGMRFDPRRMSGAMSPARVSQQRLDRRPSPMAIVSYMRPGSKTPTKIKIPIIDHGLWLTDRLGRPIRDPKTGHWIPHPTRIIDLSPAAFEALTGEKGSAKRLGVLKNITVEMLPDEPERKP